MTDVEASRDVGTDLTLAGDDVGQGRSVPWVMISMDADEAVMCWTDPGEESCGRRVGQCRVGMLVKVGADEAVLNRPWQRMV
jgi:hypothetical protein